MCEPKLEQFLAERGLALSEAKTRIVHIDEGFQLPGLHHPALQRQGADQATKGEGARHTCGD